MTKFIIIKNRECCKGYDFLKTGLKKLLKSDINIEKIIIKIIKFQDIIFYSLYEISLIFFSEAIGVIVFIL